VRAVGRLAGSRVLVTGASTGIGAATACVLATEGASLALAARRRHLLDEVAAECAQRGAPDARVYPVDLSDLDAAEDLALRADDELGGLDAVVNNAGIPKRLNVRKLPYADAEAVMRLNYFSPLRIMLALLPRFLDRGHGTFVNVGSLAGRMASPQEAAYTASKFALTGFTETAAVDLAGTGVNFRMVQPGPIRTPIWDDLPDNDPPLYGGRMYPPEDVAAVIVTALTEDRFEYFVPPDYERFFVAKAQDVNAFQARMVDYLRQTGGF
jgi:short-subunit dehydrogenase